MVSLSRQDEKYVKSNIVYSDYFQLKSNDDIQKDYLGYFQRTTQMKENIPIYKKPKLPHYLSVSSKHWSISTTDQILNLNGTCNLPTTTACDKKWIDNNTGLAVQIEVTEVVQPDYPDFYEVRAEATTILKHSYWFGFYQKLQDFHDGFPVFRKMSKDGTYFLYLMKTGQWSINAKVGANGGYMRSKSVGLPSPPSQGIWEYGNDEDWVDDSITVKPFFYPESYQLEYQGNDSKIRELFSKENIAGVYRQKTFSVDNIAYYLKEKPKMIYLIKGKKGHWMVSKYRKDKDCAEYMFQEATTNPVPNQNANWSVKIDGQFQASIGITLTPNGLKEDDDATDNLILILAISVPVGIAAFIVPAVIVCIKRKDFIVQGCGKKSPEEPVVDVNMYYGYEGDDYTYGETRVTDQNDYYDDD